MVGALGIPRDSEFGMIRTLGIAQDSKNRRIDSFANINGIGRPDEFQLEGQMH